MQPQHLELDRAPHRSAARERAPSSLLARTRTAVRERFRGSADPDAVRLREEGAGVTVGAFLESWLTEIARVTVRPRTYTSYRYVVRVHLAPGLGNLPLAFLSPADVQGRGRRAAGFPNPGRGGRGRRTGTRCTCGAAP